MSSVAPVRRALHVLSHPFHNGLEGIDMGAGPKRLLGSTAIWDDLTATGWEVKTEEIEAPDPSEPEMVRIAESDRRLARAVRNAVDADAFPLVLAGNCISCLGTVGGARESGRRLGVVWFDAHPDFDTPDRSLGFLDAMGLAVLTGSGWKHLRETIPGFAAVAENDVVLVGVRDVEDYQRPSLEASHLVRFEGGELREDGLSGALAALAGRVDGVYLHIDLDALDSSEGRANRFAASGGLSLAVLERSVELVFRHAPVLAAAVTAYDPSLDQDRRVERAAGRVIAAIGRGADRSAAASAR